MATGLGTFADAVGFGLLNDILASFSDQNAYGRPNLYEVQIHPPRGASPAMGGHNVSANSNSDCRCYHRTTKRIYHRGDIRRRD